MLKELRVTYKKKRFWFMKNFNLLISDVKCFMANEVNRLFIFIILINIGVGIFLHIENLKLKETIIENTERIEQQITQTRKRVDYRYFNTTRTIEDLYGVKVNTKDGYLK